MTEAITASCLVACLKMGDDGPAIAAIFRLESE